MCCIVFCDAGRSWVVEICNFQMVWRLGHFFGGTSWWCSFIVFIVVVLVCFHGVLPVIVILLAAFYLVCVCVCVCVCARFFVFSEQVICFSIESLDDYDYEHSFGLVLCICSSCLCPVTRDCVSLSVVVPMSVWLHWLHSVLLLWKLHFKRHYLSPVRMMQRISDATPLAWSSLAARNGFSFLNQNLQMFLHPFFFVNCLGGCGDLHIKVGNQTYQVCLSY